MVAKIKPIALFFGLLLCIISCKSKTQQVVQHSPTQISGDSQFVNSSKVIHVFVALCDNKYQGIVPVPKAIGNGQDPANNLYWGCAYGLKTFFKKHPDWQLFQSVKNPKENILERCIYKHISKEVFLIADAYDGKKIKECTKDFFLALSRNNTESIKVGNKNIWIAGSADLIAYTGHDGLMDFSLDDYPVQLDNKKREAIILACISKKYFHYGIRKSGAYPLLWTTGLMSPEAYTLSAAIDGWLNSEDVQKIQLRAAKAYNQYQKCGIKAASNLLVSGW